MFENDRVAPAPSTFSEAVVFGNGVVATSDGTVSGQFMGDLIGNSYFVPADDRMMLNDATV